jgi:hypothetical protein
MQLNKDKETTAGVGNWQLFSSDDIVMVEQAAQHWKAALAGIDKPWLCWCVNDNWSIIQQKLVRAAGWTPIVGNDTNVRQPTILEGSVYVDFNESFDYPRMYMHFPLEWVFLFTDRLAFWHSDLLLSFKDMHYCAELFENLAAGYTSAYKTRESLIRFWKITGSQRFFEVIGCTTKAASQSQFDHGCGWWRNFQFHPNFKDFKDNNLPRGFTGDHGFGIMHWHRYDNGPAKHVNVSMVGHADANNTRFTKSKEEDLNSTYSLAKICEHLGIEKLL